MTARTNSSGTRRALVTGATGFVGRHLVDNLLLAGWTVSIVIREHSVPWCSKRWIAPATDTRRVHLLVHDGTTGGMDQLVKAAHPDTVFHLASRFLAQHLPDDIESLIASNVTFGTQLLEAMCANRALQIVNVGTSWQHYQDAAYSPVNLYAATKQAFDDVARYYAEAFDMRVLNVKLFDTYGPDDPRRKLIAVLRESQFSNLPIAMSPGDQRLDLLHVEDAVGALLLAADLVEVQSDNVQDYGLPNGTRHTVREIAGTLESVTGLRCHVDWGKRPHRKREVMEPWSGDPVLPGWKPRISLEEGLRRLFV